MGKGSSCEWQLYQSCSFVSLFISQGPIQLHLTRATSDRVIQDMDHTSQVAYTLPVLLPVLHPSCTPYLTPFPAHSNAALGVCGGPCLTHWSSEAGTT